MRVFRMYVLLWPALSPRTSQKVRKLNYERIFDDARRKLRSW